MFVNKDKTMYFHPISREDAMTLGSTMEEMR